MISIPILTDVPHSDQTTTLDGTDYVLQIRYNQRGEYYTLAIGLPDGTQLRAGAKLVCSWPLFRDVADDRMPQGVLMVIASGADRSPPKLGELGPGLRCQLIYLEAAEAQAL